MENLDIGKSNMDFKYWALASKIEFCYTTTADIEGKGWTIYIHTEMLENLSHQQKKKKLIFSGTLVSYFHETLLYFHFFISYWYLQAQIYCRLSTGCIIMIFRYIEGVLKKDVKHLNSNYSLIWIKINMK